MVEFIKGNGKLTVMVTVTVASGHGSGSYRPHSGARSELPTRMESQRKGTASSKPTAVATWDDQNPPRRDDSKFASARTASGSIFC